MELAALIPSNPGKPGLPFGSVIGAVPSTVDTAGPPAITGSTYLAPNRPWNPAYPPASSGSTSGFAGPLAHNAESPARRMPLPPKSVFAGAPLGLGSSASRGPRPDTVPAS